MRTESSKKLSESMDLYKKLKYGANPDGRECSKLEEQFINQFVNMRYMKQRNKQQEKDFQLLTNFAISRYKELAFKNDRKSTQYQLLSKELELLASEKKEELLKKQKDDTGANMYEVMNSFKHKRMDVEGQLLELCKQLLNKGCIFDIFDKNNDQRYISYDNQLIHGSNEQIDTYLDDPQRYTVDDSGLITKEEPDTDFKL